MAKIDLNLGVIAPQILDQLDEQGYRYKNDDSVLKNQEFLKSIHRLRFASLVTDSQIKIILKKLRKKILSEIEVDCDENIERYKYIKFHNNYDLKLNNIYEGNFYKEGWINICGVLYRENCFTKEA